MSEIKKKVIIDCDPGHDDAIALAVALASDKIDLIGITIEQGNQTLDKTTKNAINVCNYLGKKVEIVKGVDHPIVREPIICEEIHGKTGLDGFIFPEYSQKPLEINGVEYLINKLLENKSVTLICTGPLTNIALAIRSNKNIINHIEEIILMGGSTELGNISPAAEFNILCDAEAAHIVMNFGIKVKMIGLNITRQVLVTEEIINRMELINNKCSIMFGKLMRVFNQNQLKTFGIPAGPLHDPVTVISLLDESVVKYELMNVQVEMGYGPSYGRTNCDYYHKTNGSNNVYVGMEINVERYWDIIEEHIRKYN